MHERDCSKGTITVVRCPVWCTIVCAEVIFTNESNPQKQSNHPARDRRREKRDPHPHPHERRGINASSSSCPSKLPSGCTKGHLYIQIPIYVTIQSRQFLHGNGWSVVVAWTWISSHQQRHTHTHHSEYHHTRTSIFSWFWLLTS